MAILLVLEGHFLNLLPLEAGRLGVDVFFCLSGFLMSGILFVNSQPLPTFYRRRASRILPAFVVFVLVMFGLSWWQGRSFTGTELLATLLFCGLTYRRSRGFGVAMCRSVISGP